MKRKQVTWSMIYFSLCLVWGCQKNDTVLDKVEYDGPIAISNNIETMVSDSARIKLMISGPTQLNFQNGDYEFPDGVYIEFYDQEGNISSTIKANRGFYIESEKIYRVEEDVEVQNIKNQETLTTEELFWDPNRKEVYTEKFVTIKTKTKIINSVGMVADQEFNSYQLGKVTGEIYLEEDF